MTIFNPDILIRSGWNPGTDRPKDGMLVAYLFEPFMSIYCGFYDEETDSVVGRSGFTSWGHEVLCWFLIPT